MRRVYLAIKTRFFIGLVKKRGDFFVCEHNRISVQTSLQTSLGIIHNPSKLYLFITNFLHDHRLQESKAIVCCPYLAQYDDLQKKLAIFQVVLCVSKTGLKIEHLFEEELLS